MTRRLVTALNRGVELLLAVTLVAMVAMTFGNVVLRYIFNSGIASSEELSRYLFVWLTFLGAVLVLREHGHQAIESLPDRLPPRLRKACRLTAIALSMFSAALIGKGCWEQTITNLHNAAPVTGVSVGLMYFAGVVSSIAMVIILAAELIRIAREERAGTPANGGNEQ